MDFNEHTYNKIQQYLDNELKGEELRAFEAQLRAEKELAAEVNLHQEMNHFLAETPENELRKNLDQLSRQFSTSPKKNNASSKYLLFLLPLFLLGGMGIFYLFHSNNSTVQTTIPVEKKNNKSADLVLKYPAIPPFDSSLIDWNPPQQINEYQVSNPVNSDSDSFKTNLTLDELIEKNHSQEHFKITFEQEPSDTIWMNQSAGHKRLAATIQTTVDLMKEPFFISFYNNLYDEIAPSLNLLKPYKSNETTPINLYRIDTELAIDATTSPGLYYYVLRGHEKYYAGKVTVLKKAVKKKKVPIKKVPKTTPEKTTKKTPEKQQKKTLIYAQEDKKAPAPKEEEMQVPRINDETYASASAPVSAATFEPNPALELLIRNNVRSGDFELSVANLLQEFLVTSTDKSVDFEFIGTVESSENLLENQYSIHFFSSDPTAYQNFETILTNDFNLKELEKNTYLFEFEKRLTLTPGLYYFLIENKETEQIHFVERIVVQE